MFDEKEAIEALPYWGLVEISEPAFLPPKRYLYLL
jgi:hypothetical protein